MLRKLKDYVIQLILTFTIVIVVVGEVFSPHVGNKTRHGEDKH